MTPPIFDVTNFFSSYFGNSIATNQLSQFFFLYFGNAIATNQLSHFFPLHFGNGTNQLPHFFPLHFGNAITTIFFFLSFSATWLPQFIFSPLPFLQLTWLPQLVSLWALHLVLALRTLHTHLGSSFR